MILTGNLSYYVNASTGSDGNNGLSPSTPFLTVQKAFDVIGASYLDGYSITINLADGTYTGPVLITKGWFGGTVTVQGNNTTPQNTLLSASGADTLKVRWTPFGKLLLKSVKLENTSNGGSLVANEGQGIIDIDNIICGPSGTFSQLKAEGSGAVVRAVATYKISNGGYAHCEARANAMVSIRQQTVNLQNAVSYSHAFALGSRLGFVYADDTAFTGSSATGTRWRASSNAVIYAPDITFPGDAGGVASSGGMKV